MTEPTYQPSQVLLKIAKGEFCEGEFWKITTNYELSEFGNYQCQHCKQEIDNVGEKVWIAPLVLEATNEGGHNGTVVCVLCIEEALAKLRLMI